MGGGSQPTTQTTTISDPERDKLYKLALPFFQEFAAGGPPSLPKNTIAGFNTAQRTGQNEVLRAAKGAESNLAAEGANASKFLSGAVLSPDSNPALKQWMAAADLPLEQNLTQNVLPNVRGQATAAGQFGGSRQGIAEGLATQGTQQAVGSTNANIANQGYLAGLNAFTQNLALLPQTMQAQTIPGLTTSGVGDVRQAMTQALLNQKNQQQLYPEIAPLLMGEAISGAGNSFQPQGSTTTASVPQQNPLLAGIGAGASGLSLGSQLAPMMGGKGGASALAPLVFAA